MSESEVSEEGGDEVGSPAAPSEDGAPGTTEDERGFEEDSGDDAIIGLFAWRSLIALAAIGALALAWRLLLSLTAAPPEEIALEAEAPETVEVAVDPPSSLPFVDVSEEAGIDFVHWNGATGEKLLPETMGGGVAFFDLENDGDPDLLFVNSASWPGQDDPESGPATSALYRNDGNWSFTDITREAGLDFSFYGMGVAVADIDADGDPDLYLTAVGQNRLLRNDQGRFVDITDAAGVAGAEEGWSTGAAFFDVDGDLDLDLFVVDYVRWSEDIDHALDFRLDGVGRAYGPPQSYAGTFPHLFRNDGISASGIPQFTDISDSAGLRVTSAATGEPLAKSLAVLPFDVDADGLLDVLVANDTVRNFFFHNQGGGRFEEVGELYGLAYDSNGNATGAMGVDVAHHRNDESMAFAIGNFANEMSSIYVSQGDPELFLDDAILEGVGAPSRRMLTFGVLFFDADLDGRSDLLQINGHIEEAIGGVDPSQVYQQPGQLFWNAGPENGFVEVAGEAIGDLAQPRVGRGVAYADVDGDGDLDLAVSQIGGPGALLRNEQTFGRHWLRLRLEGNAPNREAIGALVECQVEGTIQRRHVMPARGYLASVEHDLTFGLGDASAADRVVVRWPDGSKSEHGPLSAGRVHTLRPTTF